MTNLSHRLDAVLFLLLFLAAGCGTKVRKQDMSKAFPEQSMPAPAGQPVLFAALPEGFEYKSSTATYREDPRFLGKVMQDLIGLGPVPIIPLTLTYNRYESELTRMEVVQEAFKARLKKRGIPLAEGMLDMSGKPELKPGQHAMVVKLRKMEATGKYMFITLIIDSGLGLKYPISSVLMDCALWAAGKAEPLWKGTVETDSDKPAAKGLANNVFAGAAAAAAEMCIEQSGLARLRAVSMEKSFAQLIDQGRYAEAYAAASSPDQALSAVKGLARTHAGREIPEEARDLMAKGKAAASLAKGSSDFETASTAMEKALLIAPWWPSGHYNAALAEEGAGRWMEGVKHMKLYLALKPDADDREAVRMKIAELELHHERGDKPAGELR